MFVAVLEGALLLRLAPEDFVVAVGVERRVNVDQVNAGVGQLLELFQVVAAIETRVSRRDDDFGRGEAAVGFVATFFAMPRA